MRIDRYLYDLKDFRDLIQAVSNERHIVPQLIEKVYWIMHVPILPSNVHPVP